MAGVLPLGISPSAGTQLLFLFFFSFASKWRGAGSSRVTTGFPAGDSWWGWDLLSSAGTGDSPAGTRGQLGVQDPHPSSLVEQDGLWTGCGGSGHGHTAGGRWAPVSWRSRKLRNGPQNHCHFEVSGTSQGMGTAPGCPPSHLHLTGSRGGSRRDQGRGRGSGAGLRAGLGGIGLAGWWGKKKRGRGGLRAGSCRAWAARVLLGLGSLRGGGQGGTHRAGLVRVGWGVLGLWGAGTGGYWDCGVPGLWGAGDPAPAAPKRSDVALRDVVLWVVSVAGWVG